MFLCGGMRRGRLGLCGDLVPGGGSRWGLEFCLGSRHLVRLEARQHRELEVRPRGLWGARGWAVGPGTASCGQALASHPTPPLDFSKAYCPLLPLYPCCVPSPIVCLTLLILIVNLYRQSTPSERVSENDTNPVTAL